MAILIVFILLLAVGLTLGYCSSTSISARKRAIAAVQPLGTLRSDLAKQAQEIDESVSRTAIRLKDHYRTERLRAIPVDAIKRHASGLRLQALKDAGLSTILDLQGWNAQRLSAVRGVGPKSASAVASVVQTLTKAVDAVPVNPPTPPFCSEPERRLLFAVYVALTFESRLLPERAEFERILQTAEERLSEILEKTGFRDWIVRIVSARGANGVIEEAEKLKCDLEESSQIATLKECLQGLLSDVRALAHRDLSSHELTTAYELDVPLYRWRMSSALGVSGNTPRPLRPRKEESAKPAEEPASVQNVDRDSLSTNAGHVSDQSTQSSRAEDNGQTPQGGDALVHVEFGRLVSGPPLILQSSSTVASSDLRSLASRGAPSEEEDLLSSRPVSPSSAEGPEVHEPVHVEFGRLTLGPPPTPQLTQARSPSDPPRYAKTAAEALQQLDLLRAARESDVVREDSTFTPLAPVEELVTLRVGKQTEEGGVKIPVPAKPAASSNRRTRWVSANDTVMIQGVPVSGSYFYLGTQKRNPEPFVLDPALPIVRDTEQMSEESALTHRYASFDPAMRHRYLEWLGAGARNRDVPPGFGKLYYHGLERRLLQLLRKPEEDSEDQIRALLREVKRIEVLFLLTPNSVHYHSSSLLRFFTARSFIGASMPALPQLTGRGDELPFEVRLGLGCFIKENLPISADWAFHWAIVEPTIYFRTAPLRCPKEFEAGFRHLYGEKYGPGMVVKSQASMLSVAYQPMWSGGDDSKVEITFTEIPDVKALTAPLIALRQLVSEATEMVDAYSRLLGPNVEGAGTLESMLRLPLSIWSQEASASLQQLRSGIIEPMVPATSEDLLRAFGGTGEITPFRLTEFARLLRKFDIGFEPDILEGGRKPKPTDYVVLFPLPTREEETPSPSVQLAKIALTLAAIVALADEHASEEEQSTADRLIIRWPGLSLNSQARLRAVYRLTLKQPPALSSLQRRLEALTMEGREQVGSVLAEMAVSDGLVSPKEVRVLERVYTLLALDTHTLYKNLHSAPIATTQPEPSQWHSNAIEGPIGSLLDPTRLARLRQQSCEVSELLAGVFTEEEDALIPAETPQSTAASQAPLQRVSGPRAIVLTVLNTADQAFLTTLLRRDMWSREELSHAASDLQIMLDGTLERINEAALDHFGEPLIEGDDPIYIQQTLLEVAE